MPAMAECGMTMMPPSEDRSTQAAPGRDRAEPAKIWKARRYIEEHSGEELSLTAVAHIVNINPNYLSEKFKEVTGVKFVDYIARRRFARACVLLQDRRLRISEIAFAVFQSLSRFNRVFRRFAGKSPTEYRGVGGLCLAFAARPEVPNAGTGGCGWLHVSRRPT